MKKQLLIMLFTALSASVAFAQSRDERTTMRWLYHDLETENQRVKKESGASLDLMDMEIAYRDCIGKESRLEACKITLGRLETKLSSRFKDAKAALEQKHRTEVLEQSKIGSSDTNTGVTIIEENPYQWRHRRPEWGVDRPHEYHDLSKERPTFAPPPPNFTPQNRFQAGDGFR